jgi:hypothetical protein
VRSVTFCESAKSSDTCSLAALRQTPVGIRRFVFRRSSLADRAPSAPGISVAYHRRPVWCRLLILLMLSDLLLGSLVPALTLEFDNQTAVGFGNSTRLKHNSVEEPAYFAARFRSEHAVLNPADPRVTSPGRAQLYRQIFLSSGEVLALSVVVPMMQNPHVVPSSGSPTLFSLDECLRL